MEYAVVVHKDGRVEKAIGPFPSKAMAQVWANDHVVKGNKWNAVEYMSAPKIVSAVPPPAVTD